MLKKYLNKHNYFVVGSTLVAVLAIFSLLGQKDAGITGMVSLESNDAQKVTLYLFWGDGCGYCAKEKAFLDKLKLDYPELDIVMFEVWNNAENAQLMKEFAQAYGISAGGVPVTFIGDKSWVGYNDNIGSEITAKVEYCKSNDCLSPAKSLV